jgi:hypothetical protein
MRRTGPPTVPAGASKRPGRQTHVPNPANASWGTLAASLTPLHDHNRALHTTTHFEPKLHNILAGFCAKLYGLANPVD